METAARRGIERRRNIAGQDHPLAPPPHVGNRNGRHQGARVRVMRVLEDRRAIGHLSDAPEVHDRDAIADVLDDTHVVGDEHVGQAKLALERLEQVQDLRLDRDIECRDRFVAHQQLGFENERPGDADALPLAAREFVWVAPCMVGGKPYEVHHPLDFLEALRGGPEPVDPEALADAVADRCSRVERRIGILENDLDLAPERLEGSSMERADVRSLEGD